MLWWLVLFNIKNRNGGAGGVTHCIKPEDLRVIPEPIWWKERTDSKIPLTFMCMAWHIPAHAHAYNK